jgi:alpha-2-macroglobulin
MRSSHPSRGMHRKSSVVFIISILLLISLAWSLGGCRKKTPTPTITPTLPSATPTKVPQNLPPALVETDPLPGAQIALKNPITFYFNQPMQHTSVEAAVTGDPALSGGFAWRDDSTLTFTPDTSLLPGTPLTINIATTAQSARGMALLQPISLSYSTSAYLSLVQSLPANGSNDVDPTSAVVAAFNQPAVPLGADPASLPAGFTLTPSADGHGEWINTSTYIFYPEPALAGGASYRVDLNHNLVSTAGSPLETTASWSFNTVLPRLVAATPADNTFNVRLDTNVQLNFSYSMDTASVEANFSLVTSDNTPVAGESAWNEDFTTFTFTPTTLLQRDTSYSVLLGAAAAALGGTPLDESIHITWHTVPELTIYSSVPSEGGVKDIYGSLQLYISSYLSTDDIEQYITFNPSVSNLGSWIDGQMTLNFYGTFDPDTNYTLTISPDLTDLWGSRLGQTFTLHFRTAPFDPSVQFPYNPDSSFLTTQDRGILAQVTNVSSIPLTVGTLTINDLVQMFGNNGYDFRQNFNPHDPESWTFYPEVPHNQSTTVTIPVSPDGQPRTPGLYFMRLNLPNNYGYVNTLILAISHYHATLKLSPTEAFVWAVDLNTNTPAADLPVAVYDQSGQLLVSGTTDTSGIFQGPIADNEDPYNSSFALLGTPGQDNFSFAISNWNDGVTPSDFDMPVSYSPSKIFAYIYTDRPIYRPGDTVYFRLVLRQVSNGRYSLPDVSSYPLVLYDGMGVQVASYDLPLNAFATGYGEYALPPDAQPGTYSLTNPDDYNAILFQVADYRKPEINLQVAFQSTDVLSGTALVAEVNARYFFDAPAGNLPLHWALYQQNSYFNIPNYQVGPVDTSWLDVFNYNFGTGGLGSLVSEGDARTDANGLVTLNIPPPAQSGRQQYTLEITLTDESGLPVSTRSSIYVNPAKYYIGVHPDAWSYQAKSDAGFEILVADWDGNPAGERTLSAQFQRVIWVRNDPSPDTLGYQFPTYVAEYTPIASTILTTAADGTDRLTFTPPEPGTYQLDVSGDGTLTQVIVWVGGAGQAEWPSLPNQRLRLVADQDGYKPGDTAQVFVPNPFSSTALGLLTVERGFVLRYQILQLEPGGSTIPLAISTDDAPNVYIAVTLLGQDAQGNPDFRQGYVNLPVDPSFKYLKVTLISQPQRTGPGEPVSFTLRITDANDSPVQGEFSLSVVDLAVLSLAEPNVEDIFTAFYGQQALNVRTGISLAASGQRLRYMPGGMGGGGGGEAPASVTRENFPDTAYWDAQIVTDANGEATVSMDLPDSLTTWQVLVRGLTKDTQVGEAQLQVITTKELLVRPVTPRFMVVGDHAMLAAVVQNNTPNELQGTALLQATGFILDDPNSASQQVTIPPNGRTRLEWWGTAEDVASASLRFSVQAGDLQDAVLVSKGALPVLRYTAPQTFATSGTLTEGGQRLELVSLPVTFDASSGSLSVELDPSLAAAMLDALEALENYPYDCTEQVLSRFLPNLVTYTTLQSFGIESPDLKARLDRTLDEGLQHLLTLQNGDGGWGWWQEDESDAYITAYVLFGLAKAREAGITVPDEPINKARSYISSSMIIPNKTTQAWMLDRLAFENFALQQSGAGNLDSANHLYEVRDQLSPWAKALLALSLEPFSSSSPQIPTLISDLQSTAIRSATGVHWEADHPDWRNMTSTLSNSAMVVYTLAQLEPASTVLPDAVNYLMSNRQATGFWNSSYESAWILLAMDEVMKGTGELGSTYAFSASLNGTQIATGQAGGETQLNPVVTSLPISTLYPHDPNGLVIQRDSGTGRLYYTAALNVYRPVEDVASLDRGISISRLYFTLGSDLKTATPVTVTKVGDTLTVRLTIVLPTDAYHFVVEDYIPAGTEILNTNLKTSQLGETGEPGPLYDPRDPFGNGWGWWLFNAAQIYDDHISWTASYLPAGSYDLTFTLTVLLVGEYHLLPARAWMFYFPEVQGNSAGGLLEIKP